jgi:hypothetical protein
MTPGSVLMLVDPGIEQKISPHPSRSFRIIVAIRPGNPVNYKFFRFIYEKQGNLE